MKKIYTTPSNLYKKERLIISICLGTLLIIFFTFLVYHQEKSKDIGEATKREYEVTTIYDEPVPLSKPNTSQTNNSFNDDFSIQIFNLINEIRLKNNLLQLSWSDELYSCASIRAIESSTSWSHTRPNGKEWYTVNENLMYGENLAKGYSKSKDLVDAWMKSESHKENILFNFNSMAISSYKGNDGKLYVALEFGY